MRRLLATVSVPLLLALPARAQSEVAGEARAKVEPSGPPRHYGNLRVGASTANGNRRPELCLELAPLEFLSIEGCGTGSGFLHRDPLPEVAHFRSKLRLMSFTTSLGIFQPLVSAGFAELQVGEDEAGFQFGGTDERRGSTAGPELGLGLRYLRPLSPDFELVGDLSLGMAWLKHAPELARPADTWLPSASVSIGVGF
jgi:hypothetical protein